MNIIDHLSVGAPDIEKAADFYDGLLGTLGIEQLAASDAFVAYGAAAIQFLVMKPEDGSDYSAGNGVHVCFTAPNRTAVDAFHNFAVANGGEDAGRPGPRPGYPIPDVYTAFVRDPFGNKLEAIHNGFLQKPEDTEERKSWIQRFFT